MSFTISHIFESDFERVQVSAKHFNGNIEWSLELESDSERTMTIVLFGIPLDGFYRPEVCWEISADVEGTVGGTIIRRKQHQLYENDGDYKDSILISKQCYKQFLGVKSIMKDGKIEVNLKIRKISSKGIRVFQQLEHYNPNLPSSDFAFLIGKRTLFCHRQFLMLGSPVFAEILKENFFSKEKPFKIRLDPEMTEENFLEFLHQLYFAAEPIRDDNWEILLHFADKYKVPQVLFSCEHFLLSKLRLSKRTDLSKLDAIKILPLSFRYGMKWMQAKCLDRIFPHIERHELRKIFIDRHYLAMNDIQKLDLVETILTQRF